MGLDGIELVMEVEETFSFSIRDEDAATFYTVGQLYALSKTLASIDLAIPSPAKSRSYSSYTPPLPAARKG